MAFGIKKKQLTKLMLPRNRKYSDESSSTASMNYDCSRMDPLPLLARGVSTAKAYDFEIVKEQVRVIREITPIPLLPYVEPTYMENHFRPPSPIMAKPEVSYRWYLGGRNENEVVLEDVEVFKPFFNFEASMREEDNDMEDDVDTSLLHGGSSKSVFFKPTLKSSSSFSPRSKFREMDLDDRAYLMNETAISNDWNARQLAFDLEVVEDDALTDEPPLWAFQTDDFTVEPPAINFKKAPSLSPKNLSIDTNKVVDAKLLQNPYERLVCNIPVSRRYVNRKSSPNRRSNRRNPRRRVSTELRGSKFLPNLSTVTERSSEEDASQILTPRNFAPHRVQLSTSGLSEEGTVDTCSSKETL